MTGRHSRPSQNSVDRYEALWLRYTPGMPPPARVDPFSSKNFRVEIDGIAASDFLEVTGIEADVPVIDYRTGGDRIAAARKLPGEANFSNLILRRGLTPDLSLWNWMQQTLQGQVVRKSISVVLLDDARQEVLRFNVTNAWPVRWSGPMLNGEKNEVALETLEVTYEGLSVVA